jgi:hypothetical protein
MNRGGFSWKRFSGVSRAKSKISRAIGVPLTKSGRQRKIGAAIGALASGGKPGKTGAGAGCLVLIIMLNLLGASTAMLAGCRMVGLRTSTSAIKSTEGLQWRKAGFSTEEAKVWMDFGFPVEDAKKWREAGNNRVYVSLQSRVADAKKWKDEGFISEEAGWWITGNVSTEKAVAFKKRPDSEAERKQLNEEILGWINAGIPFTQFQKWAEKRFTPQSAGIWHGCGYTPEEADDELAEQDRVLKTGFDMNDIYTSDALKKTSPYSVKRKFFYIDCAEGIQLLDQFSGIYSIGTYNQHPCFVLLKFKGQDAPTPGSKIKAKGRGVGVFKYTSALGSFQTIPVLEVIAMKNQSTVNPFWPDVD